MSSQSLFQNRMWAWAAEAGLALFLFVIPSMAQNNSGDYVFLVGSGYLCETADSSACPAMVKSAEGSSYNMSGAGTFSAQSKSVTAVGTFTRKSANGNSLETGIWIANELVRFDSYGIAPGAMMREGWVFGPRFGPRRTPMLSGPMPAGGLAVFRIRLLPMCGPARTATLEVNCTLGKVPEEHPREGIRLTFEGSAGEFDEEVSGRTIFVLTRAPAGAAPPPSATQGDTNPEPPSAPQ